MELFSTLRCISTDVCRTLNFRDRTPQSLKVPVANCCLPFHCGLKSWKDYANQAYDV